MGVAALVLGIVGFAFIGLSVVLGMIGAIVGILCSVLAVVLGVVARKSSGGKAGLALGAVSLVLVVALVLLFTGRTVKMSEPTASPATVSPAVPAK